MPEDRLRDVLRILREALERDGAERAAFLDAACGADADLRREVEALLAESAAGSRSLLDTPPWAVPALEAGQRLGPYEVVGLVGTGGMGAVYQARDTRLKRTVALKVLSGAGALDPAARDRLTREAQAIAALNHPHICTLYDVGHDVPTDGAGKPDGGTAGRALDYLVMEYLEGETLASRLRAGPLPLDDALEIGMQITDALAAAHRQGIVHRDLKPANIMLAKLGGSKQVKLLDFGLAKLTHRAGIGASSAAVLESMTTPGAVMGTVPYMAPEQLEGREVDARADLFSFGCVLYEMLTGRRAFAGDSQAAVISAIMTAPAPPVSSGRRRFPSAVEDLVANCLAKNRKDRPSAAEVIETLLDVSRDPQLRARPWRHRTLAILGAVVLLAVTAAGWQVVSRFGKATSPAVTYSVVMPGRVAINTAYGSPVAVAGDGSGVVYRGDEPGRVQLYWQNLNGGSGWALAGTEAATNPFLSPDTRWLGFWLGQTLRKLPLQSGHVVEGSEPAEIAGAKRVAQGRGAAWAADGGVVYGANGTGLWYVPADGTEARPLTRLDASKHESAHGWPTFLPGDRLVLFTVLDASGRFDRSAVALLSLDTGRWARVIEGGGFARYLPSGHIVYARKSTVPAAPFDAKSGRATGSAVPVLTDVGFLANQLASAFDVTRDGTLVYANIMERALENALLWVNRDGSPEQAAPEHRFYSGNQQAVSPDGQRFATVIFDDPYDSIWIYHLHEQRWQQITLPGDCHFPLWSPRGDQLAFNSNRDGAWNLYTVSADGEGAPERLTHSEHYQWPYAWSPDGRFLAYEESNPESSGPSTMETWILPFDRSGPPWRWGAEGTQTVVPTFSPDGRWLAYQSRESGKLEVHARPFPGPGRKLTVSGKDGGLAPLWSADGREIFYITRLADTHIMSRTVESTAPLRLSEPRVAFALPFGLYTPLEYHSRAFSVTPDGRRVLVMQTDERKPDRVNTLTVIREWSKEVQAKLSGSR